MFINITGIKYVYITETNLPYTFGANSVYFLATSFSTAWTLPQEIAHM